MAGLLNFPAFASKCLADKPLELLGAKRRRSVVHSTRCRRLAASIWIDNQPRLRIHAKTTHSTFVSINQGNDQCSASGRINPAPGYRRAANTTTVRPETRVTSPMTTRSKKSARADTAKMVPRVAGLGTSVEWAFDSNLTATRVENGGRPRTELA